MIVSKMNDRQNIQILSLTVVRRPVRKVLLRLEQHYQSKIPRSQCAICLGPTILAQRNINPGTTLWPPLAVGSWILQVVVGRAAAE